MSSMEPMPPQHDFSTPLLRVFVEVAARGSFTAAAPVLGYTQSAVSRQFQPLEEEAGTTLFDRLPRGVRLTEPGRRLLPHAQAVLDRLDAARQELTDLSELATGRLRIGAFATADAALVPQAIATFQRRYPDVQITLREGFTSGLLELLGAGEADVAVVSYSTVAAPRRLRPPQTPGRFHVRRSATDAPLGPPPPSPTHRSAGRAVDRGQLPPRGHPDQCLPADRLPATHRLRRPRLDGQTRFRCRRHRNHVGPVAWPPRPYAPTSNWSAPPRRHAPRQIYTATISGLSPSPPPAPSSTSSTPDRFDLRPRRSGRDLLAAGGRTGVRSGPCLVCGALQ